MQVKNTLKTSHPVFAKVTLSIAELQLEDVVKVAWNFASLPCPIIVCQPDKYVKELHQQVNAKHWDEEHKDSPKLIYARPVVYRSYHGVVMKKGLVGNIP